MQVLRVCYYYTKITFMKLSTILLCGALLSSTAVLADDYETLQMEKVQNPMLWADVPDPDVIRVGDTFYLVSTTMHLMPGAPRRT